MLIMLAVYCLVAVVVTGIVRILDDPYGHSSSWSDWAQAIVTGIFWLPVLLYVVGVIGYQRFKERRR